MMAPHELGEGRLEPGIPNDRAQKMLRIDATGAPSSLIGRLLVGSYITGQDQVLVTARGGLTTAQRREVHRVVDRLLGMTVVGDSPAVVEVQNFIDPGKYELPRLLHRVVQLLRSELEVCHAALVGRDSPGLERIESIEEEVDQILSADGTAAPPLVRKPAHRAGHRRRESPLSDRLPARGEGARGHRGPDPRHRDRPRGEPGRLPRVAPVSLLRTRPSGPAAGGHPHQDHGRIRSAFRRGGEHDAQSDRARTTEGQRPRTVDRAARVEPEGRHGGPAAGLQPGHGARDAGHRQRGHDQPKRGTRDRGAVPELAC